MIQTLTGEAIRIREDWRLWLASGFVFWSFAGGKIMPAILARPDKRRFVGSYGTGEFIDGVDGARLYIETYGDKDAPPLILTHGWGMDLTIWGPLRDALAQWFQVTVWDLPGMGRSKPGSAGITIEAFAANLQRVIQRTTTKRVVLISHSIGGMTTQTLARDHSAFFETRVAGTALLNTTHTNPLNTMILSGLVRAFQKPLIEPLMHLTRWLYPLAWINSWQSYFNGTAHLANRLGFGPEVTGGQLNHTALLATRNSPGAQAAGNLAMFHWDASRALIS